MYAIYGDIYHQYTPNVSIYAIHGSYGIGGIRFENHFLMMMEPIETRTVKLVPGGYAPPPAGPPPAEG